MVKEAEEMLVSSASIDAELIEGVGMVSIGLVIAWGRACTEAARTTKVAKDANLVENMLAKSCKDGQREIKNAIKA